MGVGGVVPDKLVKIALDSKQDHNNSDKVGFVTAWNSYAVCDLPFMVHNNLLFA